MNKKNEQHFKLKDLAPRSLGAVRIKADSLAAQPVTDALNELWNKSSGISSELSDYVRKSGDTGIGPLGLTGTMSADGGVRIGKFFEEGVEVYAQGENSHAAGRNVGVSASDAWAWSSGKNGIYEISPEMSGTFSVNPIGKLEGFYVGDKSVQTTLNERFDDNSLLYICDNHDEAGMCSAILSFQLERMQKFGFFYEDPEWKCVNNNRGVTQYPATIGYIGGDRQQPNKTTGEGRGDRSGVHSWAIDETTRQLKQDVKSTDFNGLVSMQTFGDYEFAVRCCAVSGESSGWNGVVAAAMNDNAGNLHTISFLRSPNPANGSHWYCGLDVVDPQLIGLSGIYGTMLASCPVLDGEESGLPGWTRCGAGTMIKVKREGDVFTAWTTKFQQNKQSVAEDELGYLLSVDIGTLSEQYDALKLFVDKPTPIGYCSRGQDFSRFETACSPSISGYTVADLENKTAIKYDIENKTWLPCEYDEKKLLDAGKFACNKITGKQYFNNGSSIRNMNEAELFQPKETFNLKTTNGMKQAIRSILVMLGVDEACITD